MQKEEKELERDVIEKLEKKFEILDITTADVAIIVYARDFNELFENAALGMMNIITDISKVEQKIEKNVSCEGIDLESLMFNWLNEILFLIDAESLLFSKFCVNVEKMGENGYKLNAKCLGEEINEEKHEIKTHVKAATYHRMKIEKKSIYSATIIFDV